MNELRGGGASIDEALIRYRIEKRLAGRRDLLLHLFVFLGVALLFRLNVAWLDWQGYTLLGGVWAIPLAWHALRYYHRCGPGAFRRADEIERAIDEQMERAGADEDDELLIEERVSRRVAARRILAAHGMTSVMLLLSYLPVAIRDGMAFRFDAGEHIMELAGFMGLAFALHFLRFFFVHGRTPAGRALKIDAEIEKRWHRSWANSRARRKEHEREGMAMDLGDVRGSRLRLSDDGEVEVAFDGRPLPSQRQYSQGGKP